LWLGLGPVVLVLFLIWIFVLASGSWGHGLVRKHKSDRDALAHNQLPACQDVWISIGCSLFICRYLDSMVGSSDIRTSYRRSDPDLESTRLVTGGGGGRRRDGRRTTNATNAGCITPDPWSLMRWTGSRHWNPFQTIVFFQPWKQGRDSLSPASTIHVVLTGLSGTGTCFGLVGPLQWHVGITWRGVGEEQPVIPLVRRRMELTDICTDWPTRPGFEPLSTRLLGEGINRIGQSG
jgi:hypothetical protein